MRHLLTLPVLLLMQLAAQAQQCCPYMHPIQVLPANPQAGDAIRLVFTATSPSQGFQISKQFVRSGDTLRFTSCYFAGPAAATQTYRDTISVGQLRGGNYTIVFLGRLSYSAQQCTDDRRNTTIMSMPVANGVLASRVSVADWALYPVPATGRQLQLRTPAHESLQAIRLLDVTGRECYAHPAAELAQANEVRQLRLPPLPAGTYTLRIQLASGAVKSQRVVLQ